MKMKSPHKVAKTMSAKETADALNISMATLYAYVSRGLIRSEAAKEGERGHARNRRYNAQDIEKLLAKKEAALLPEKAAAAAAQAAIQKTAANALHWGEP